ncbi:MAG: ATP-binding cassette domain-containing protein, partial [Kiritimatiellae bacterium]|nr:ATP-binding cassette domain-containing protein [Kiritimatiellia bacterium]
SVARQSKAIMVRQIIHKSIPYTMETVSVVGLLVIFFILMKTSDSIENIFPLLSLLGVATIRLKQMVSKIALSINTINATRAYIPGIITDIKELEELEKQRKKKELPVEKGDGFESLELKKISYIYPATTINAIDDVSIEVKRGESIAFVGPTGCGKTTLVNIILGLLDPQSGTVVVNGRDISSDITNWRTCLGYIPQSVFLIDDTIRANIAFGVSGEDVDEVKLQSIIDLACLTEFVKEQPDGIDTVVGERGIRLSGGQRQRLGIARALYTEPEVLIMDEATSALDNKTESDVMQAIQNMKENRTLIMIAHRLSTVENCDKLYCLGDGAVKGSGSYSELTTSLPEFRALAMVSRKECL